MYDVNRKTYRSEIPFIINTPIYEYDIAKANLNILYAKGIINDDKYSEILKFGRGQREIYFGNLSKNKEISDTLSKGLTEYRSKFIESNNLKDTDILSVKNDAFFIIGNKVSNTKFGNVEFKLKNIYTSYFYISKLEFYYALDLINDKELLDVKGISDEKLIRHKDHFILFLCSIFESIQNNTSENSFNLIFEFYNKYINKELPYGYYREFNADSEYRLSFPNGMQWMSNSMDEKCFEYINIGYNLNIIMEIFSIVNLLYNRNK